MRKGKKTVQENFSNYLLHAVENTIRTYCKTKYLILENEVLSEKDLEESLEEPQQPLDETEVMGCEFKGIIEMEKLLHQITDNHLLKAFCSLSKMGREVMCLRILYEKSFKEIGEIEGITKKKAEDTYYNSIKKVRKIVGGTKYEKRR
ncbi:sigma-70 family RNA polymerase sigma factor [Lachnospiraceae bacterium DSM 108991]|uniref:Sigma-70 family RNA polymerase sigma factor n=1 Tax=Claveliimonas monacensis TaxID=2779351 RepID=A0ABR9RLY7_9FIRM|nr:sigma-70 family RNA polymerase sigma factor [Claveliimonas monacensis]MBE5063979.1 sigma-70 family RNA polymerase sigma factor [Claveliimonas monacensis]